MKEDRQQHLIRSRIHRPRTLASATGSPLGTIYRSIKSVIPLPGIFLLGLCFTLAAKAQSLADLLTGQVKTQGVVISLYEPGQLKPSLKVKADRVFTDYERKGFFRLGVFPLGVMENVVFEICQTGPTTNRLIQLHDWVGAPVAKRLEFRNVTFVAADGCTNRLECGRARIGPGGQLELLDGVRFLSGPDQIEAVRATLQVSGELAGQIDLTCTPPRTVNLFAGKPFQKKSPKDNHENKNDDGRISAHVQLPAAGTNGG